MERELGKGAMGVVYLGRDPVIGRRVALKTIRATAEDDSEQREFNERFMREAQAAGTLSHPNIVTIHDVGEEVETQTSFIAMEYVEGKNLKQLLKDKVAFSWDRVAEISMSVADALDYAHRRGIVHRDVKPANIIILTSDGTVKITDFGIAKIEASSLTETGQFLGTPNYMSPEQVTGETVDGRSDLFSLGVVLYELLTKRKPFIGDNLTSISYKIVHEEYPPPETYDATIPGEFGPILARALAKDPAARFQSGKDFHAALAEFRTRHAEMEMLKDLGEMVAQAENLGPVSTVESKKTPMPEAPAPPQGGVSKGPVGLGGGATSLEDLARRGRSDLNPALVGPAPTNLDSSIPDWSLDTDALKSPAEREAAKKKDRETPEPVSSPGTLVSDVQRGVNKPAVTPASAPILNEENRPTERIQTIPGPVASTAPVSQASVPTPPRGVPPISGPAASRVAAPPTPVRGVPTLQSSPTPPMAPRTPTAPVPPIPRPVPPPAPLASSGPPASAAPGSPGRPAGAPAIRDVSAPIPQQRSAGPRPGGPRPPGRDITGPVGPRQPTGPLPLADSRPKNYREALRLSVNRRWVLVVIGAAILAGVAIIGFLAQRSSSIAGRGGDEAAAREALAKKKLLEDGTRLLGAGQPAEARVKFLELVRLAPESAAARSALQQSEQLLAKKQEDERKAAEAGAYLAEARRARASSDWARAVVEADGTLAVDPGNVEAREIRDAAQAEIKKQGRAAQKKAESQIRTLKASPRPKPTPAPEPAAAAAPASQEPPPAPAPPAAGPRVRLKVAFKAPIPQGYVMIRRNDVEIWRRAFDFGRKSGGGTLEGEVDVASGAGEYKVWVIATDRSVSEYLVVPLTVGEGRTLVLDVDAQRKLAVSLR